MRFSYSIAFSSKLDRSVYSLIQQYGIKGFITSHQWSTYKVNIHIWIFVYLKLTPTPPNFEVKSLILLKILIIVIYLTNGVSAFFTDEWE